MFRNSHPSSRTANGVPVRGGEGSRSSRREPAGLFQPLPGWVWAATFALVLAGVTTRYPLLTAAAVLTLPLCASLLRFRGESPILFACYGFQWLQIVAALFYCDVYDVGMDEVLEAAEVEKATWFCLAGVASLAVGMRCALSNLGRGHEVARLLESEIERIDMTRLFQIWLASAALGTVAEGIGWRVTSIHQFVVPLYNLKWVFFFMLSYLVLYRDKGHALLLAAMGLEFFFGFFGWFSKYKDGLMLFMIVALSVRRSLNPRLKLGVVAVMALGFFASVFYASIKIEYREFSSGGRSGAHGLIRRSVAERMDWLAGKIQRMDEKTFDKGTRSLLARLQYTSMVGLVVSHVPRFEPHSNGELWWGAVKHVLMPRFIFRHKAVLDDSERARRFTGKRLAGMEAGTSIGIGYMAESYADFGFPGMLFPVLLLGAFMGRIYQVAIWNRHSALLGTAIGTAMLFSVLGSFATSNSKILGGLLVLCLAYWALNKAFGGQVMRWLKGG